MFMYISFIFLSPQDSIIRFLMRFPEVLPRDIRKLTDMIPRTVLLENYVSLRITLRKYV